MYHKLNWARRNKVGTMSKDRVEFQLDLCSVSNATRTAFRRAMGEELPRPRASLALPYRPEDYITIICRPSQFARFLIYRNDEGGSNGFKCLSPKLVPAPAPVAQPLDVSGNPA